MAELLVTGGAGFIGANFVRHWTDRHPADGVVVLDSLTYAGNFESLRERVDAGRIQFVHGDICDEALVGELLDRHQVTMLVHFAAESHVDRSISGPDEFLRTNILGTHALLKAARARWCAAGGRREGVRFHHVSTDEVFGSLGPTDPAFHEDTPYAPNSPYAASKASSDHLVRAYSETYGLPVTVTNCSNNYGPYQFPEKLIPLAISRALTGAQIPVYGDGQNIRDWLYVADHCRAIETVLAGGRAGRTYNVGGNCERRNLELIDRLCVAIDAAFAADATARERFPACPAARAAATRELVGFVRDRPGHDRRYAVDGGRIERELGFRPEVGLDAGLRATVRWYLDNETWWRPLLDRAATAR